MVTLGVSADKQGGFEPNAPHHWMTAHLHESQTNEGFGKKRENYIEICYKNVIPLIQKCIIA